MHFNFRLGHCQKHVTHIRSNITLILWVDDMIYHFCLMYTEFIKTLLTLELNPHIEMLWPYLYGGVVHIYIYIYTCRPNWYLQQCGTFWIKAIDFKIITLVNTTIFNKMNLNNVLTYLNLNLVLGVVWNLYLYDLSPCASLYQM